MGAEERIFVFEERAAASNISSSQGITNIKGDSLFSGVINNIWETTVFKTGCIALL